MMDEQKLSIAQALPKIKHYCAYQERCHSEVREKLMGYGLIKNDLEEVISKLIEENYLCEERFAILFAGGKFRIKQWGKIKIKYQLVQKQVSENCIKKALAAIDDKSYISTLKKLATLKANNLKGEKNIYTKKRQLQNHLRTKGFEGYLVNEVVNAIVK